MRQLAALFALTVVALSSSAAAQSAYPIQAKPKFAGVFDVTTGAFVSAKSAMAPPTEQSVYLNTTSVPFFLPLGSCVTLFEEGRLPGPDPTCRIQDNAYELSLFEVGYCTSAATGFVDIDLAVFDTGALSLCSTSTPYAGEAPIWSFQSTAFSLPLPGSTASGQLACWIVGFVLPAGKCMQAGGQDTDRFHWSFRNNNTVSQLGSGGAGPLLAGAAQTNVGAGTFCNPSSGSTSATGLGNDDSFWANVDGVAVGGTPPACATTPPAYSVSTGCVTLGGGVFSGLHMRLDAKISGACAPKVNAYCTAKVTSAGCTPLLTCAGGASMSAGAGFGLYALGLRPQQSGRFFYSAAGFQASPFQGGWLCMDSPVRRLPAQNTGSTGGACGSDPASGSLTFDFNTYLAASSDPLLQPGTVLALQAWARDPQSASTTSLTGALLAQIDP